MAFNISSLASGAFTIESLSNLILVTPNVDIGYQPQNADGSNEQLPKAFFFDYEGDQTLSLMSEITDHYVEDNKAIADQIALKPEEFTVNGFVAELNDIAPLPLAPIKEVAEALTFVSNYVPEVSRTALIAYDTAKFAYDTANSILNSAVQTFSNITNGSALGTVQTKQQVAFLDFYGYWQARRLFTIQTPWMIMNDMVIKSLKAVQSSETESYTDFEITFKKMRFASSNIVNLSETIGSILSGHSQNQADPKINKGSQSPENTNTLESKLP